MRSWDASTKSWETWRATAGPSRERGPALVNAVLSGVRDYLMSHGGAACGTGPRRVYSDGFRRFIVRLADAGQPGQGKTVEELASAAGVPLGTLKDWLSVPRGRRLPASRLLGPCPADRRA